MNIHNPSFSPLLAEQSIDERERVQLEFWKELSVFEQSLTQRMGAPLFSFYDGPPFATGLPHYGHLLAGTIKDVILRYKTMCGFYVPRRFGWDCHGLPVENEIEKSFDIQGHGGIRAFGIARFNEECRKIVLRYTKEWQATVERMARWVSFQEVYHTMDRSFMESVWWTFSQLYQKGLVYQGYKVVPFSTKLGTPLSNFEASENYKEVEDPAITVAFPLVDEKNLSLLAWTTTPWTLISNLALMVGSELWYVTVRDPSTGSCYLLAEGCLALHAPKEGAWEPLARCQGKELLGRQYHPPFDYFLDKRAEGAFRVIGSNEVTLDEGTGIVHSAPAFGEADFFACQQAKIPMVCPVDDEGCFTDEVPPFSGKHVKAADSEIIAALKARGSLFSDGRCRHRYPFCWRSDTPLIYKAVTSWFVKVEAIKEELLAANQEIYWMPGHIKDGRFGKWLEGARDWAISRNRYWGTPIPIWQSDDGDLLIVGSVRELEELSGVSVNDLHRHHIDAIVIEKDGKSYRRIPEVFDCWFESGSMPYAQNHYPFENKEFFEKGFPADFIAEGIDQTRAWFYTLTVLSTALFGKPAFKNVIVNGIVLAEDGAKMSKRLRNYPDPMEVIHRYGADALRLTLLQSKAVQGENLSFSEKAVEGALRQVLLPFWNSYSFFVTYARIYCWQPEQTTSELLERAAARTDHEKADREEAGAAISLDRWILSRLQELIQTIRVKMELYDLYGAVEPLTAFIDELTNWYIRRSRRRFWNSVESVDRACAFATLHHTLRTIARLMAPFLPFHAEAVWRNLREECSALSVHLTDYPEVDDTLRDKPLEEEMAIVQHVCTLGHSLRKEQKLKVRQPLRTLVVITKDARLQRAIELHTPLICDELNVKELLFREDEEEFVHLKVKPNFRILGKRAGGAMPELQKALDTLPYEKIQELLQGSSLNLMLSSGSFSITPEEVVVVREVRNEIAAAHRDGITVIFDTHLDSELIQEGLAREIINKVNTLRKEKNFDITDRISLSLSSSEAVYSCLEKHKELIFGEALIVDLSIGKLPDGDQVDLNGHLATLLIAKR